MSVSSDGGRSWKRIVRLNEFSPDGNGLALSAAADGSAYFLTGTFAYSTEDRGRNWNPPPQGEARYVRLPRHAAEVSKPLVFGLFYAVRAYPGQLQRGPVLRRSTDGGRTWTVVTRWPTTVRPR